MRNFTPHRFIEHDCNQANECQDRFEIHEKTNKLPAYGDIVFGVFYDTELKEWWIEADEEFCAPINFCPYCARKLDFIPETPIAVET